MARARIIHSNDPTKTVFDDIHNKQKHDITPKKVSVLDIRTYTITHFNSFKECSRVLGVPRFTIKDNVLRNSSIPYKFYFFRYTTDNIDWPQLNSEEIEYYCKEVNKSITVEDFLKFNFQYDCESGEITRRRPHRYRQLIKSGDQTGTGHSMGYRAVSSPKGPLLAHRVAWFLLHGEWPTYELDHKNGDKTDNRNINLRDVIHQYNSQNRKDVKGYYQHKAGGYVAQLSVDGQYKYLGYYKHEEDARNAYLTAKEKYHLGYIS